MGSKSRMGQKVRKNADYIAITRYADEIGLPWELHPPVSKGHPFLRCTMPDGSCFDFTITCTPGGYIDSASRVAKFKRKMLAHINRV